MSLDPRVVDLFEELHAEMEQRHTDIVTAVLHSEPITRYLHEFKGLQTAVDSLLERFPEVRVIRGLEENYPYGELNDRVMTYAAEFPDEQR